VSQSMLVLVQQTKQKDDAMQLGPLLTITHVATLTTSTTTINTFVVAFEAVKLDQCRTTYTLMSLPLIFFDFLSKHIDSFELTITFLLCKPY